jgi:hypothetical protein
MTLSPRYRLGYGRVRNFRLTQELHLLQQYRLAVIEIGEMAGDGPVYFAETHSMPVLWREILAIQLPLAALFPAPKAGKIRNGYSAKIELKGYSGQRILNDRTDALQFGFTS